ncbi:MAG TPA: hypothetical protein VNG51_20550 [Ktedonobacteraceae bacterium]|nr:hypothetical protein [Ktedonobacteraceae bacterium]
MAEEEKDGETSDDIVEVAEDGTEEKNTGVRLDKFTWEAEDLVFVDPKIQKKYEALLAGEQAAQKQPKRRARKKPEPKK